LSQVKNLDVDRARGAELERALRLLRRGENPARILDELSRRLMNKLIHAPTTALREAAKLRT
jgi:glutamyl-tRNA reductase